MFIFHGFLTYFIIGIRCKVETDIIDDFNNIKERYRYMFTTLDERSRAFDKHLLHMQGLMCELANIPLEDLTPVGLPSQENVWVCGRICCETAEGRLNKTSVTLEGSKRDSSGRRIQLDLSEINSYSLFPGQIVLVEGTNSSGRRMIVRRIVEGTAAPLPSSTPAQLLQYHHTSAYQGGD